MAGLQVLPSKKWRYLIISALLLATVALVTSLILLQLVKTSPGFNIAEDNEDMERAVAAAEEGQWEDVMSVLQDKPYLVSTGFMCDNFENALVK